MGRLRVAVIGFGFWGRNHVRVFNELSESEVVAVCDMNPERAESAGEEFGVNFYTDSLEMFRREGVDAVSVCVWSTNLADEALKALKAGKHVLVEKPMARSSEEARIIIEEAAARRLLLTVGFIERFNPAVQDLKGLIDDGEIGSIVSASAKRVSRWPERIGDVGVVKDTAIHDIDMMRYIFGDDPVAVYANVGNLKYTRFEDYAQIMLTFKDGRTAFIEANWLTPYKTRRLTVTGSKAIASIDYITQEVRVDTERQTVMPRRRWEEPLKNELLAFLCCILEGREPRVTGMDGFKALRIAEAALESSAKQKIVRLD